MESMYYESRPYVLMLLAFISPKASYGSHVAMFFAALLLLGTSVILHARLVHRGVIPK